jgi:formylglycine-generating enzyme required for sulfatase activity
LPREPEAGEIIRIDLGQIKVGGFLGIGAKTLGVTMSFAWCPPGTFLMGSPTTESERKDDETQHRVTLTKGYYLGIHQVTQAQWQAVMGSNPGDFKGDNRPVENVSWDDCQAFCQKLSSKTGKRFRLPTEAEWEHACRAGTTTPFHFGETISTDQANYDGRDYDGNDYDGNDTYGKGKKGQYRKETTPVGNFPANAWGLFDMHGNVYEWCHGWYGDYPQGDTKDPQDTNNGDARVLRGASWYVSPGGTRAACRDWCAPDYRDGYFGCRVLLCLD